MLLGALVFVSYDPNGLLSGYTTLPIQIFNWTGRPQEEFRVLAAAASIYPERITENRAILWVAIAASLVSLAILLLSPRWSFRPEA